MSVHQGSYEALLEVTYGPKGCGSLMWHHRGWAIQALPGVGQVTLGRARTRKGRIPSTLLLLVTCPGNHADKHGLVPKHWTESISSAPPTS